MIKTVYSGESINHRFFSVVKRMPFSRAEALAYKEKHGADLYREPPTYWITMSLPWRENLYDMNYDQYIKKIASWLLGLDFGWIDEINYY